MCLVRVAVYNKNSTSHWSAAIRINTLIEQLASLSPCKAGQICPLFWALEHLFHTNIHACLSRADRTLCSCVASIGKVDVKLERDNIILSLMSIIWLTKFLLKNKFGILSSSSPANELPIMADAMMNRTMFIFWRVNNLYSTLPVRIWWSFAAFYSWFLINPYPQGLNSHCESRCRSSHSLICKKVVYSLVMLAVRNAKRFEALLFSSAW